MSNRRTIIVTPNLIDDSYVTGSTFNNGVLSLNLNNNKADVDTNISISGVSSGGNSAHLNYRKNGNLSPFNFISSLDGSFFEMGYHIPNNSSLNEVEVTIGFVQSTNTFFIPIEVRVHQQNTSNELSVSGGTLLYSDTLTISNETTYNKTFHSLTNISLSSYTDNLLTVGLGDFSSSGATLVECMVSLTLKHN